VRLDVKWLVYQLFNITSIQKQISWYTLTIAYIRIPKLTKTAQVGTHADSLIAEAVLKGITGFDLDTAWEAVHKDATVPPRDDETTV
jgi:hypothetical protein